jgi:hypothetical protein
VGGLLEQPLQLAAGQAVGPRGVERAAHLARDLVLADHDGLQSAGHREEVGCGIRSLVDGDRRAQQVRAHIGGLGHRLDDGLDGDGLATGERLVDVEVGLEAAARGEHDGARDEQLAFDERTRRSGRPHRETLQDVEARVPMVRGQTEEHVPNLNV